MPLAPAELFKAAKAAIEAVSETMARRAGTPIGSAFEGEVGTDAINGALFPMPPALKLNSGQVIAGANHGDALNALAKHVGTGNMDEAMSHVAEQGWLFKDKFINDEEATQIEDFVNSLGPTVKVRHVMMRDLEPKTPRGGKAARAGTAGDLTLGPGR